MQIFLLFPAIVFAFVLAVPLSLIHLAGFSVFGQTDPKPRFAALFGMQIIALSLFFFSTLIFVGNPFGASGSLSDPIKLLTRLLGDFAILIAAGLIGYLIVLGLLTKASQRQLEWRRVGLALIPLAVLTLAIAVPLLISGIQVKSGAARWPASIETSENAAVEISETWELSEKTDPLTDDQVFEAVSRLAEDNFYADVSFSCSVGAHDRALTLSFSFYDKNGLPASMDEEALSDGTHSFAAYDYRVGDMAAKSVPIIFKRPSSNAMVIPLAVLNDEETSTLASQRKLVVSPKLIEGQPAFSIDLAELSARKVWDACNVRPRATQPGLDPTTGVPAPDLQNASTEELAFRLVTLAARTIRSKAYEQSIHVWQGGCEIGETYGRSPEKWERTWEGNYKPNQSVGFRYKTSFRYIDPASISSSDQAAFKKGETVWITMGPGSGGIKRRDWWDANLSADGTTPQLVYQGRIDNLPYMDIFQLTGINTQLKFEFIRSDSVEGTKLIKELLRRCPKGRGYGDDVWSADGEFFATLVLREEGKDVVKILRPASSASSLPEPEETDRSPTSAGGDVPQVVITVDADGKVRGSSGDVEDEGALTAQLRATAARRPQPHVVIAGNRSTAFDALRRVLVASREAGITKSYLAMQASRNGDVSMDEPIDVEVIPTSSSGRTESDVVTLQVDYDGTVLWNGDIVKDLQQLRANLREVSANQPGAEIRVQAHGRVRYTYVEVVTRSIVKEGMGRNLRFDLSDSTDRML